MTVSIDVFTGYVTSVLELVPTTKAGILRTRLVTKMKELGIPPYLHEEVLSSLLLNGASFQNNSYSVRVSRRNPVVIPANLGSVNYVREVVDVPLNGADAVPHVRAMRTVHVTSANFKGEDDKEDENAKPVAILRGNLDSLCLALGLRLQFPSVWESAELTGLLEGETVPQVEDPVLDVKNGGIIVTFTGLFFFNIKGPFFESYYEKGWCKIVLRQTYFPVGI